MNRPKPTASVLPEQRYVSTAQVAQALGVSVTTVKRWVDDGVLPAHRTAGGHRKLLMGDVFRLVREGNLPQADLSRLMPERTLTPIDPGQVRAELQSVLQTGELDQIRSIVHAAYRSGMNVENLADEVIASLMHQIGHGWQGGKVDVGTEHRITQSFVATLYELRGILRVHAEKNRPVAVGGAPEHDHYILSTLLAKLTLLDAGWDAINLGPHTPFAALRSAIDQLSPQLIWLSISYLPKPQEFLAEYLKFYEYAEEQGVAVAVGGQGLTGSIRRKMPYTMYGDGFRQLAAFARSLHRRPEHPRRGRPPLTIHPRTTESKSADDSFLNPETEAPPCQLNES